MNVKTYIVCNIIIASTRTGLPLGRPIVGILRWRWWRRYSSLYHGNAISSTLVRTLRRRRHTPRAILSLTLITSVITSITLVGNKMPLLVNVVVVMLMIEPITRSFFIVLMLHVVMVSLLLGLRCFTFTSFSPAVDAVVNVVKVFVAKLINPTETDFLRDPNCKRLVNIAS